MVGDFAYSTARSAPIRPAWLLSADCMVGESPVATASECKVADHGVDRRAQQSRSLGERSIKHCARRRQLADRFIVHGAADRSQRQHDRHTLGKRHQGDDQNEQSVLEAGQL